MLWCTFLGHQRAGISLQLKELQTLLDFEFFSQFLGSQGWQE